MTSATANIKDNIMRKLILSLIVLLCLSFAGSVLAHQPDVVFFKKGDLIINNPEISQAFYDELKGGPRDYFITSDKSFDLYINLLVPEIENRHGRYSANIFFDNNGQEELVVLVDGASFEWQEYYESYGRDYYIKGPEFEKQLPAGKYKIEVFSADNLGKYVLVVGKKESYDAKAVLNIYWQLPYLKIVYFKTSVLQFFLTPFGIAGIGAIGGLLIILAIFNYLIALIKEKIRQRVAKTILLTSNGMQVKDEIIKLLQKPAYDITVAFINTAAKPQDNTDYVKRDLDIMREVGFNVEEIDIEGKNSGQLMKLLELKDIIFVEGGNTFYLLAAMRRCGFEKVIKKLLKQGKVYIGASAGSMVAGITIDTANWKNQDKNIVNLKNLRGLGLVPFNVFVHYTPEHAQLVNEKVKKSKYPLRVLTDDQAILCQAKNIMFLGQGSENVFVKRKSAINSILKIGILFVLLVALCFLMYIYFTGGFKL